MATKEAAAAKDAVATAHKDFALCLVLTNTKWVKDKGPSLDLIAAVIRNELPPQWRGQVHVIDAVACRDALPAYVTRTPLVVHYARAVYPEPGWPSVALLHAWAYHRAGVFVDVRKMLFGDAGADEDLGALYTDTERHFHTAQRQIGPSLETKASAAMDGGILQQLPSDTSSTCREVARRPPRPAAASTGAGSGAGGAAGADEDAASRHVSFDDVDFEVTTSPLDMKKIAEEREAKRQARMARTEAAAKRELERIQKQMKRD